MLNLDELRKPGYIGVVTFWLRISLIGICFAAAIFSLYWAVITGSKIWIKGCTHSIIIAAVFLAAISLTTAAFLFLGWIGTNFLFEKSSIHFYGMLSILCLILCCVLMSFSSETRSAIYLQDLIDFCTRNFNEDFVKDFWAEQKTAYALERWVKHRSSDLYPSIATFFGIWLPCTVIYLICVGVPEFQKQSNQNDLEELNPNEAKEAQGNTNLPANNFVAAGEQRAPEGYGVDQAGAYGVPRQGEQWNANTGQGGVNPGDQGSEYSVSYVSQTGGH
jgi:hypothetical protein